MSLKTIVKRVYHLLPFKKPFFIVLKKVWSPPKRIYQHLYFTGKIKVKTLDDKAFQMYHYGFELENELFWRGIKNGWEQQSVQLWEKLCTMNKCIVDVGANTGIYALIAKTLQPKAQVFAFEPVKRVFEKLEANLKLNNYQDIVAVEKALSNADGEAIIYDQAETDHTYSVTVGKDLTTAETQSIETTIDIIRLDTFIEQHQLEKVDLIKIDVETHEPEVLEGMGKYLKQMLPTLLIEVLNDEVAQKVQKLVEGLDYLYFDLDEKTVPKPIERIRKSSYYNLLICTPTVAQKLQLI